MASRTNKITSNIIYLCNLNRVNVWRNNTLGVFDPVVAAKKIWDLVQSGRITQAEIKKALQSSYRKSHEKIGAPDIIGYTKQGRFVGFEVKGKGDVLSIEQQNFLIDIFLKDGLVAVIAEEPEKVKFTVWGTDQIPVMTELDFQEWIKKFSK
jgi:hypothetical protein